MNPNVEAFMRVLDSDDNSTGGGTASAVAGAMAAALVAMVARLSIGKDGMEDKHFYHQIAEEASNLSDRLFTGGYEDSQAFGAIRAAYRLPKGTDEEKATRRAAIQKAMIHAARVPLTNAEKCARVLELGGKLQGRSNPNAASDLECARHLARAGLLGCVANVEINVPHITDDDVASALTDQAEDLIETTERTSERS